MDVKLRLYKILVNRISVIGVRYREYVREHPKRRLRSKLYLLGLNFRYRVLRDKKLTAKSVRRPVNGSESEECRKDADELIRQLSQYDVISFDVFDTLIFRPFCRPEDIFYLIGEALDQPNFRTVRIKAEKLARKRSCETDINEIYSVMEELTGISADKGIQTETDIEIKLCRANPFMHKVYSELLRKGKIIIITTDMYLTGDIISRMLSKCGFDGYEKLYVSCERKTGKFDGGIWKQIKKDFPDKKSFIHIGDNPYSDIKSSRKNGFAALYYRNVNTSGEKHRPEMSPLIGSAYKGIVNMHLRSGYEGYSPQYEYGYICGGLLVTGFCGYLHTLARQKDADKILFFSRDGYIIKQVYDSLYPNENTEYVYWSRAAAVKLGFEYFEYDYFRRFVYHKTDKGITLGEILEAMELKAEMFGLDGKALLTSENADETVGILKEQKEKITAAYSEMNKAAEIYFKKILSESDNAIAADCGWAGSGYIILEKLIRERWRLNTKLYGALVGANGKYQAESDHSEMYFRKRKLFSYCFASDFNNELYKLHNAEQDHNIYLELLLSAPEASFVGFSLNEGLRFESRNEAEHNKAYIDEMHKGITDFSKQYAEIFKDFPYMLNISGQDAYAPFALCLENEGRFPKYVLGECKFSADVSGKATKLKGR